jgi:ABC-2 type transport system ATP-binding protein
VTVDMPAVQTRGLRKVFPKGRRTLLDRLRRAPDQRGEYVAVDGIDLDVERGEIFGVLGPNGAGKTTTMRMLATLLEPSGGSARVLGFDVRSQPREVRRRMGAVLSGERSLYWKLTARENLEYFAALYHVAPRVARPRIDRALEVVGLADRSDDYVERYSTGMRQRLVLARALLPDPPILLLDEPTVGLDPQSARHLRQVVSDLRGEGRTVLLTTHYMEEADNLCDRIAIIDGGRIVALGTPAELKRQVRTEQVVKLELVGGDPDHVQARLGELGVVARHGHQEGALALTLHSESARDLVPEAFDAARAVGAKLKHVEVVPVTLEDVFIELTGRELRE